MDKQHSNSNSSSNSSNNNNNRSTNTNESAALPATHAADQQPFNQPTHQLEPEAQVRGRRPIRSAAARTTRRLQSPSPSTSNRHLPSPASSYASATSSPAITKKMTASELRQLITDAGISIPNRCNKSELIKLYESISPSTPPPRTPGRPAPATPPILNTAHLRQQLPNQDHPRKQPGNQKPHKIHHPIVIRKPGTLPKPHPYPSMTITKTSILISFLTPPSSGHQLLNPVYPPTLILQLHPQPLIKPSFLFLLTLLLSLQPRPFILTSPLSPVLMPIHFLLLLIPLIFLLPFPPIPSPCTHFQY